jgi:hypothetical protein
MRHIDIDKKTVGKNSRDIVSLSPGKISFRLRTTTMW